MSKRFKVLSIDFDFFQDVTKEQLNNYPDGVDVSTDLSSIIWGRYYVEGSESKELIEAVTLNRILYCQMLSIIAQQNKSIPVMVANSHKHIYDFIKDNMDSSPLSIFNVDLHHDIFNDRATLDCGNWVRHIKNEYPDTNIHWIARPVSMECYGIDAEEMHIELDFEKIKNIEFDAIFLCRSDPWTPPHLDAFFDRMLGLISATFTNARAEKSVLQPRDLSDIIEAENKMFEEMRRRMKDASSNPIT